MKTTHITTFHRSISATKYMKKRTNIAPHYTFIKTLLLFLVLHNVPIISFANTTNDIPIAPSLLQQNDLVAIVAPAWWDPNEKIIINKTITTLKAWGLEVVIGNSIGVHHGQFSGADGVRLVDLQSMLDNPNIKAIFALRGGHGCARIVDDLDFTNFLQHPKWIVGFSDITTLHSQLHHLGVTSIHGEMPKHFPEPAYEPSINSLKVALFEGRATLVAEPTSYNRLGEAKAPVVGGNLTILCSNIGTKVDLNTKGKILVLEDIGEKLYTIDRMMVQLKRSGKLQHLAGLVIGGMEALQDKPDMPFGKTIEELILEHVAEYTYPVAFNMPISHTAPNLAFYHGAEGSLMVTKDFAKLFFGNN